MLNNHTLVVRKYLAVQFFFMLSGFVIAYAYEDRLRAGMGLKEFYLRRAIRLYPLIVLGALGGSAWFAFSEPAFWNSAQTPIKIMAAAIGIPHEHSDFSFGLFSINPPEWSLFFELIAYLIFGAIIIYLKVRHLAILCIISFIFYAIHEKTHFSDPSDPFFENAFGASFSFSMGILLWRKRRMFSGLKDSFPFYILSAALVAICVLPASYGYLADIFAVAILFPVVILSGAARRPGADGKLERFLGDLSYPLYVLHWPILLATKFLFLGLIGPAAAIGLGCGAAVLYAYVMLRAFDQPVRRWLGRRLDARRVADGPSAPASNRA